MLYNKTRQTEKDDMKLAIMAIFFIYGLLYDASNILFYSINDGNVIWVRYVSSISAVKWKWNDQDCFGYSL